MNDDYSDKDLMAQIQAGDIAAFEMLYHRYAKRLLNFFYRMIWDRNLSEDLLQDVFSKLWQNAAQYHGRGAVSTYLFQIAKFHCLNELDKRKRRPLSFVVNQIDDACAVYSVDATPGPSDMLQYSELEQAIAGAVDSLSDKLRLTFNLAFYQKLRYSEIADILEIPLGTVKSRMATAEAQLRERLQAYRI